MFIGPVTGLSNQKVNNLLSSSFGVRLAWKCKKTVTWNNDGLKGSGFKANFPAADKFFDFTYLIPMWYIGNLKLLI